MAKSWEEARDKSRTEADRNSGSWNSKSTSWGDGAYMRELGKEGIKRQQEGMRQVASDTTAGYGKKAPKKTRKTAARKR